MHIVRDRAEARWLPARHRYALARLAAFLILRTARHEQRPGLILAVDRDQSATENIAISAWIALTTTFYFAAPLHGAWKVLALPLAIMALQVPIYVMGAVLLPLLGRSLYAYNHRINSALLWVLLIIASSYFATTDGMARYVAYFFFAVVALNAGAAAALLLMRGKVAQWEGRCGA
ncbi:MAG TPA: hypothetical protein VGR02_10210 [Thermoanaerobaculia bacterium]|jgi:hypothetical protein|nr:hypothetical protein [Thermoanaerobaculia bacterium]